MPLFNHKRPLRRDGHRMLMASSGFSRGQDSMEVPFETLRRLAGGPDRVDQLTAGTPKTTGEQRVVTQTNHGGGHLLRMGSNDDAVQFVADRFPHPSFRDRHD